MLRITIFTAGLVGAFLFFGYNDSVVFTLGYLIGWAITFTVLDNWWRIMYFCAYWIMVGLDELKMQKAANWVLLNWVLVLEEKRINER